MKIIIFEDHTAGNFFPLAMTRPVWDLRSGCFTLAERITRIADGIVAGGTYSCYYYTRDVLVPLLRERHPHMIINTPLAADDEKCLWINCRVKPGPFLSTLNDNEVLVREGIPLCAKTSSTPAIGPGTDPSGVLMEMTGINHKSDSALTVFQYLWDLVDENPGLLSDDIELCRGDGEFIDCDVTITGDRRLLYIEKGARIDPYVSFDLMEGPVLIKKARSFIPFPVSRDPARSVQKVSFLAPVCGGMLHRGPVPYRRRGRTVDIPGKVEQIS